MSTVRPPRRRGRTWAQRIVLVLGVAVVLTCTASAVAAAYFGFRWSQIDRVDGIDIAAAAAGEPANYLIVGTDSPAGTADDDPDASGSAGAGAPGCHCTATTMLLRVDPPEPPARPLPL